MAQYRENYAVDVDGHLITYTNGALSGDPEIIKLIRKHDALETPVQLVAPYGEYITSNLDMNDRLGVVAALSSPHPGRARVLQAPKEVWVYLITEAGESGYYIGGTQPVDDTLPETVKAEEPQY